MQGVRFSNRCDYCKKRKIKCDESWPTCGACLRTGRTCSGPPKPFSQFVSRTSDSPPKGRNAALALPTLNTPEPGKTSPPVDVEFRNSGSTSSSASFNHPTTAQSGPLVVHKRRSVESGQGAYLVLKSRPRGSKTGRTPSPGRSVPSTEGGLLVSRYERCFAAGAGSDLDIGLRIPWLRLILPRLGSSQLLYETANLFLTSWTNELQNPSAPPSIDRRLYGKALVTLNKALGDPATAYTVETLAATGLMQKVDFDYGMANRAANEDHHSAGMAALMAGKGPPSADDELEVSLCFENVSILLLYFLARPGNFFSRPEWFGAMRDALDRVYASEPHTRCEYALSMQMALWPDLIQGLRALDSSHPDPVALVDLTGQIREMADELRRLDDTVVAEMLADGRIRYVADAAAIGSHRYDFGRYEYNRFFHHHALSCIVVHRMLQRAQELDGGGGGADPRLEADILGWSERVWQTLPFVVGKSRTVQEEFLAPLILSIESAADMGLRLYLTDKVLELGGPRSQLIVDYPMERFLAMCKAFTGR